MKPNRRVLVVEDDPNVCDLYRDILAGDALPFDTGDAGRLEVRVVHDGAAAIEAVDRARRENRPYCGGFFDLMLPGTPAGPDVLREVRRIDPELFCCVVSGADSDVVGDLQPIFENHEQDWEFLRKPAEPDEIYLRGRKMVARWNHRRLAGERAERRDALASLGLLVAGLTHEINSPVAFVQSNLETLRNYGERIRRSVRALEEVLDQAATGAVDPESVRRARGVLAKAKLEFVLGDMDELIGQSQDGVGLVRDISKALKGLSPTGSVRDDVDVNACCERALLVARHELKRRAQVVRDYGELPTWRGSTAELTQVLINLLVNAAQAIEERGTVTVRTSASDGAIAVEIEDTGCGIPPELLEQVFDPFFTTKGEGQGAGLGLVLATDLLAKCGGRLTVRSEVGRGTCFRIELPADAEIATTSEGDEK